MGRYQLAIAVLAGVIFGMACKDQIERGADKAMDTGSRALIDTAHAGQASDCQQWEFQAIDPAGAIPAGWEPFAWQMCSPGYSCLGLRRCAD